MSDTKPDFRRGAEAAQEATKGGGFARTEFFRIDDGETAILRFLTDAEDWIVVDQHQMIPTKPSPKDFSGSWPERMGSVCRNDPAFQGVYDDCYICEFVVDGTKVRKPSARSWALACLREEVIGDGSEALGGAEMKGKVLGIRDLTREVTLPAKDDRPEQKVTEKAIVVVNMGYKNFFSILQGFAGRYGTILDRDYWVKRSGASTDTTYQIVPLDPIEIDGERFDLREKKFRSRYETDLNLAEVVTERSDDEYYARFFDPRVEPSNDGKVEKTGKDAAPAAPDSDIDPAKMQALADRVKGYNAEPNDDDGGNGKAPEKSEDSSKAEAPAAAGKMRDFS